SLSASPASAVVRRIMPAFATSYAGAPPGDLRPCHSAEIDAMFTMAPPPPRRIASMACRVANIAPSRSVCTVSAQWSSGSPGRNGADALFTSTVTRPNVRSPNAIRSFTWRSSRTSARKNAVRPPPAAISRTDSSPPASAISETRTAAPSPEQLAGELVERMKLPVEARRADEQHAARGDDRTTVVVAAGVGQPFRGQLRILAERDLPADRAGVEIDRVERPPGRRDGRVAVGIEKDALAVAAVLEPARVARQPRIPALVDTRDQELDHVVDVARAHVGERRHAARVPPDERRALLARAPVADADERRRRRRSLPVFAVARRALAVVERRVVVRDQLDDPRHLVRVDVEQRRVRVEGRAAPFGAAVDAGKDDGALERGRREESLRVLPETRQHRRV